jgi:iron complex transport system substrate-binding protein
VIGGDMPVRSQCYIAFLLLFLSNTFSFAAPSHPPHRIVSLVPTLTEELYLLGAGDNIVGVTVYCQRPPQAQTKEKVGTVIDVNIEKIVELRPDLVIASPLTDHKQIRKLRGLGLRVEIFDAPTDFRGLCESFLALSRLVGKEQQAEQVLERAKRELEDVKKRIESLAKSRVFVQIGANPLFTADRESFINDLIERAGGINIASDAKTGIYSREEVIKRNPDTILIVTMGIVGEREKEVWLRYETIGAVKNRRIFAIDSYRVCSPTPVSFVQIVKELARLFHDQQ